MQTASTSETAIWERVIHPERDNLPPEAARYFLSLSFELGDLERMRELAEKNRRGTLDPDEREALRAYRQMGLQLDLLKSKARLALKAQTNGS
jgi:hypothetical protein